jgi:hypothetical protein
VSFVSQIKGRIEIGGAAGSEGGGGSDKRAQKIASFVLVFVHSYLLHNF